MFLAFTTGEEELLAQKSKLDDHKLAESERAQRKRAILHLSRIFRFLPTIFRKAWVKVPERYVVDNSLQDISARSPVARPDSGPPRQSFDSRTSRYPRSAVNGSARFPKPQPTDEEGFEDVGLNDEIKPKKKGLFSRFTNDPPESPVSADGSRPTSSHYGFHIPGRKRGASGQGAELGNIDQPKANGGEDGVVR